jgi:acyl-CoA thioester hydrolase
MTAATTHLDGTISDGKHRQQVRVYYEDTDFSGIVYHASYLRFMERGRTNYLRLIGASHRAMFETGEPQTQGAFVVCHMSISFHKAGYMDDVLDIVTTPQEVKGASATLNQKVMRGEELLVEAEVQFAFVSGGRARPLPNALRAAMKADQKSGSVA